MTAERFVPVPFASATGARMYRTGDAARYLADGRIEFLGRVDQQVKVRGFRIEPGEIEACLRRRADVSDAVVVVREDVTDSKRIVAYVVPRAGAPVTVHDLREQLKMELPDYLVPAAFVLLESLPLTPNGKVDRRALPEPRVVTEADELPAALTPIEEKLAEIWSDILSVGKVGLHDNFFEIGGHSLLATRTVARICDVFRVELPLECLFESPTIAAVATRIEAARNDGSSIRSLPPIRPRVKDSQIPLSYAQERLWFLYKLDPGNPSYNIPAALKLTGLLNQPALIQSLNEIVRRHEVLRTRFAEVNGYPVQVVTTATDLQVQMIDLSELSDAEAEAKAISLAQTDARTPFDLTQAPLVRCSLLRLSDEVHILLLNIHHIVFDGWSLGVFIRELATLYEKFSMGQPSPLPELNIQYGDYSIWQREWLNETVLAKELAYWKRQLGEAPSSWEMPTDHPRPAVQTHEGVRQPFRLPGTLIASLNDLSRREGATLFMTLLTAFLAVLARLTAQDDIVIGTDVANRNRVETDGLLGFFVNMLTLRTDLSGDPTLREALARVREVTLGAYQHQDFPFGALIKELQKERDLSRTPLFQVAFALQNTPLDELRLPGLSIQPMVIDIGTVQLDLIFSMIEDAGGLRGIVAYNNSLFDSETIMRLLKQFQTVLEALVDDPEQHLSDIRLLSDEETSGYLLEDFPDADLSRKDFENLLTEIQNQL
jgi:acyl carrier protein